MKNFLAILLFVGGFGGYYGYRYISEARTTISDNLVQLEGQNKIAAAREQEFKTIVNALELSRQVAAKRKELADIQAQQQAIDKQRAVIAQRKQKEVSGSRQSLVGTVLTDLTLLDGRKFAEARITKIDDSGVLLTVPSGVVKVKPTDLTPEIRQLLQFK